MMQTGRTFGHRFERAPARMQKQSKLSFAKYDKGAIKSRLFFIGGPPRAGDLSAYAV
jgi:hypothetical protein